MVSISMCMYIVYMSMSIYVRLLHLLPENKPALSTSSWGGLLFTVEAGEPAAWLCLWLYPRKHVNWKTFFVRRNLLVCVFTLHHIVLYCIELYFIILYCIHLMLFGFCVWFGWLSVKNKHYFIVPRSFRNFQELKDEIWHFIRDLHQCSHSYIYLCICMCLCLRLLFIIILLQYRPIFMFIYWYWYYRTGLISRIFVISLLVWGAQV